MLGRKIYITHVAGGAGLRMPAFALGTIYHEEDPVHAARSIATANGLFLAVGPVADGDTHCAVIAKHGRSRGTFRPPFVEIRYRVGRRESPG